MSAKWTMLIYMAGDNNLESAGLDDLKEMRKVGSDENVTVLVQLDTEENKTTRYRVLKGKLETLQEMPGVDCGDPAVLTDFLKWGIANYPADHYLVNIWNHGGGWENLPEDFDYERMRAAEPEKGAKLMRVKKSIFRKTAQNIGARPPDARAIAIDGGSQDYLDNQELRKAFEDAMPEGKKFDVFACDACLMNNFEIAYEMRKTADFMVGSEETEPGAGWPYDAILRRLTANPATSPEELAKLIVVEYGKSFEGRGEDATQSALDLNNIDPIVKSIDTMSSVLLNNLDNMKDGIALARDYSQKFYHHPEYIDLADFAGLLSEKISGSADLQSATDTLLSANSGFVIANTTVGPSVGHAKGASIFFPPDENIPPEYADLLLTRDGNTWSQFLKRYFAARSTR
ncbi:MAG: clostripain-related cysteine peptidase [Halobacteriota archaeon]